MGELMARTDWASTPLSDPGDWPQSLRTATGMCLESRFPMLIMWGPEFVMIYNEAFRPILGAKHPYSMGQMGAECWAEAWDQVGPMLTGVLEGGVAVGFEDLLVPLERNGQQEDCYFTFSYSPITDEDHATAAVLVTVFETTERVLSERRMRCLRELAEARADANSTAEVLSRAAAVLGEFSSEVPFACLYRVDGAGNVLESALVGLSEPVVPSAWPIQDVIERRTAIRVTEVAAAASGSSPEYRPSAAIAIPVVGPSQSDVEAVLVFGLNPRRVLDSGYRSFLNLIVEDLAAGVASATAREQERQQAEALAALDRAKTAFLTNVSHEFRTPLTLMLGPVEEMIAGANDTPELVARLEGVHRNGKRLLRLVNSLLDFTRIEAGQSEPHLETVDVGALTAQIASSFAEVCEQAGIRLQLDCRWAAGAIDVAMWETIVLNLVSNAFKFTAKGEITVRVAPVEPGQILLTVSDTGTGIADADLAHVAERFYRATGSRGRSAEGSGIGLALVHNLAELHGGELEIESELGAGTTVTIRLPTQLSEVSVVPAPGSAGVSSYGENPYVVEALEWLSLENGPSFSGEKSPPDRPLVLVADDNADMRGYLERVLRSRWNVLAVGDGASALEAARNLSPDLIVTDVMMPTLDGFALVEAMRSDPELAGVPVIMVSARAGSESAGEGFAAGSDDYLVKPFRSEDLVNRVAARLRAVARARSSSDRQALVAERANALAELSTKLSAVASHADLVAEVVASPVASLGATVAALATVDPDRTHIRIQYAGELHAEFLDRYHVLAFEAPVPIAEVVRRGQAMVISDTTQLDERYEAVVRDAAPAARASLIEPLRGSGGRVIGGLALAWPFAREFGDEELQFAEQVAQLAATTLERIQVTEHEHKIATALQERLLELKVSSPAAVLSAVYQPAQEMLRVGGDWYTASVLDGGSRIAISVGDVVGRGLEGATVMSQLRSAVAVAALTSPDPSVVLDVLDRYATQVSGAACATVAYAVVDPTDASVEYACAGHPYPLLLDANGRVRYLEEGRRTPLGSYSSSVGRTTARSEFSPGSLLVLYTDGLIERRGESLDAGLKRLAAVAAECRLLPVGDVCSQLLARLTPEKGYADDVAIVTVRPAGATAQSFIQAIPARIDGLAQLRHRFRSWLRSRDPACPPEVEHDVLLAVSEALNNGIEHGNEFDARLAVSLEVFADASWISATVSDSGRWKSDSAASRRAPARGHGLSLIHGLSQDVETVRTAVGTRVTMRFKTRR
jgi:signal transduction histidine kinase/serine phosphatase RsbU (regulator of sigma subunit)/CheY-like chemotaxis protein